MTAAIPSIQETVVSGIAEMARRIGTNVRIFVKLAP